MSGHLNPANNSRIRKMPGINTSMFYVGSTGSFTEMHVEDSLADSVNVIHAGKGKIWMIIDRRDYARTNEMVAQMLHNVSRDDVNGKSKTELKMCILPLQHKNVVLTPRFLDEHEIRYEFVVQKAGDLLYIRYGILYQVVNLGLNVAEAINVGSDAWNFANELKTLYSCDSCQLIHAATNTDVNMSVKIGKPNARTHRCSTCSRIFGTKKLLVKHEKDDHGATYLCRICDRQFQHVHSLTWHLSIVHSASEKPSLCPICDKAVKDVLRHQRERHMKLVECSGCKTNFTRYDLAKHEKTCKKISCTDCSKDFNSRHSLANHRARWCNK